MRVPHYFFRAEKKVSKKVAGREPLRASICLEYVQRFGRAGRPRPAANQSYTRTVLSLRGAQRATWQSPGRGTSATNPRRLTLVRRCHFERRRSRSREIPYEGNETKHTRLTQILACMGSMPRIRNENKCTRLIMKTAVGRRNDRFRFREIPTVTPFPRNDKLYSRVRRFIRLNII